MGGIGPLNMLLLNSTCTIAPNDGKEPVIKLRSNLNTKSKGGIAVLFIVPSRFKLPQSISVTRWDIQLTPSAIQQSEFNGFHMLTCSMFKCSPEARFIIFGQSIDREFTTEKNKEILDIGMVAFYKGFISRQWEDRSHVTRFSLNLIEVKFNQNSKC